MSELKARTARSIADEEEMLELGADCPIEPAQVYLKSEVDKVIEEKDEIIDELKENIDELQKATDSAWGKVNAIYDELRHHKYKRCLAMARWCRLRGRLFGACGLYEKELWALKWHKHWLELADKFKEAK